MNCLRQIAKLAHYYHLFLSIGITMIRKSGKYCVQYIEPAVLTLIGLINGAYHDLPHWRSNQRPQNAEPKLSH